jgi:hypothetical protein
LREAGRTEARRVHLLQDTARDNDPRSTVRDVSPLSDLNGGDLVSLETKTCENRWNISTHLLSRLAESTYEPIFRRVVLRQ